MLAARGDATLATCATCARNRRFRSDKSVLKRVRVYSDVIAVTTCLAVLARWAFIAVLNDKFSFLSEMQLLFHSSGKLKARSRAWIAAP